ncbi:hypothetical protein FE783_29225 [Paenibacillus mesophilus]|nr:hypothetical protein FE783_29225 [Paenibacillus mesophilus]
MKKRSTHAGSVREPVDGANRCGRHAEWTSEQPDRNVPLYGSLCRTGQVGSGGNACPISAGTVSTTHRCAASALKHGDAAPYRKSEFAAGQTN